MTDIAIIGAGASGIMAAVTAACGGAKILVLEKNSVIGKKILSTGNGRCNFTNSDMSLSHFHSSDLESAREILSSYDNNSVISFMESIGIYPVEKNGYFYPYTNQASDVRYALEMKLAEFDNISVQYDTEITDIQAKNHYFIIKDSDNNTYKSKAVIIATGGKAMPISGSDGTGYLLAKQLGHTVKKPVPSLVALKCREKYFKKLKGIRLKGQISLFVDETLVAKDTGEIQLTDYGVSGICTFNISSYATSALKSDKNVTVSINLLPDLAADEVTDMLNRRIYEYGYNKTLSDSFVGLFNQKLVKVLLDRTGIKDYPVASELKPHEFTKLCACISDFKSVVIDSMGFEKAQTTSGGVLLSDLKPQTMESKVTGGLFFCGEITDVDGECGGYNLQWAFSSGHSAGNGALAYVKN